MYTTRPLVITRKMYECALLHNLHALLDSTSKQLDKSARAIKLFEQILREAIAERKKQEVCPPAVAPEIGDDLLDITGEHVCATVQRVEFMQ